MGRLAAACGTIALAALIAGGCGSGGDDGGGDDALAPGAAAGSGLGWLPQDTWLVATADISPGTIDTAAQTLQRLPAWALVESLLPASDGDGLREALLTAVARESAGGPGEKPVSAARMEAAFGDDAGFAVFGDDLPVQLADTAEAPVVAWLAVDDAASAREVADDLVGTGEEREHEGVEYVETEGGSAWAVRDELLLVTTTAEQMELLIDTREGDGPTLADDPAALAVLEAGIGDGTLGLAVQTDPLLAALPELSREASAQLEPGTAASDQLRAIGAAAATQVVDPLVPDWIAGSITIDATGLGLDGAWSNPRELADPEPATRELAERMPASATSVSAAGSDGTVLGRVQEVWSVLGDPAQARRLAACRQRPPAQARWCTAAVETAIAVLEDEQLAAALVEQGDTVTAVVQDLGGDAATASRTRAVEVATTLDLDAQQYLPAPARTLLAPRGGRIEAQEVDGIRVYGFPAAARSAVAESLEGDVEQLGESADYRATLDAVDVPDEIGSFGWTDVAGTVTGLLAMAGAQSPELQRALPLVDNNLSDIPGAVSWTSREDVGGIDVGTSRTVVPILE